jgi:hypothetical protein
MHEIPMQRFDGNQPEITRKGLKSSRITFQNGISDLLGAHSDHVDIRPAYGGGDHLELELRTPRTDEGSTRFNIDRVTSGDASDQIGTIRVSSILPEGQLSPQQHTYRTDEEGVVRRTDIYVDIAPDDIEVKTAYKVNPITGRVIEAEFVDEPSAMDVIRKRAVGQQEAINRDREAGLNDQPVAPHEIRGLIEVAKHGEPLPVLGSTLRDLVSERIAYPDTRPTQAENVVAGEELYNLINNTLQALADEVVIEDDARKWRESRQLSETDTWTTEVISAGSEGENQITTELQNTEGNLVATERVIFELEGPFAVGRYHMFGAINEDGSEDDIQAKAPLGIKDIRKVRSYLKERRPE